MNSSQVAGFGYFVRSDFGQADMMMSGVVTPGQVEIAPEPAGHGLLNRRHHLLIHVGEQPVIELS
jgi:hypothetical protein